MRVRLTAAVAAAMVVHAAPAYAAADKAATNVTPNLISVQSANGGDQGLGNCGHNSSRHGPRIPVSEYGGGGNGKGNGGWIGTPCPQSAPDKPTPVETATPTDASPISESPTTDYPSWDGVVAS